MRTELILTDEEINRIANKLGEKLFKNRGLEVNTLKYGFIREFFGMELWFEKITDVKDGFVLRDINNHDIILGIFPESN